MPPPASPTSRGEAWIAKPTVTEQACLLLGRFCERTALVLKEGQLATGANPQDAAKLFSSLCDLSKALQASALYLEACNCRSRLELVMVSPGISMDLQDRVLDLADAMSSLRACQIQAPTDIVEDIDYFNGQLRKAIVPGDAEVEKLVADLMQQVTLKFMHCADTKILNSLLDQLISLLNNGGEDHTVSITSEAQALKDAAAHEKDPIQAFFMLQVADLLAARVRRASRSNTLNTLAETSGSKPPRVKVPLTVSTKAVDPMQSAVSEWALLSPNLLMSPKPGQSKPEQSKAETQDSGSKHDDGHVVTFAKNENMEPPKQWWGDRRSSRCLLALEQPETHALERRLRRSAGSRSLSLSLAEHPFANGDLPDVLSPRHSFLSPKNSHTSTPVGSPMARLASAHSFGPYFISSAPSVPSSVFEASMTLHELSEVWPDDTGQLADVLSQRDPVVRHIAATVLALGADADPHVRAQLAQREMVAVLVGMLGAWEEALAADAARLLRYLARDAPARRVIREEGAVPALLLLIQRGVDATVEAATRALTNLLCDSEPAAAAAAATGAVTLLVLMLGCGRDALCQVAAAALANMLKGSEARQQLAMKAGGLMALIKLLHSGSLATQTAAARALAPLVVHDSTKGAAVREGVVPLLSKMLENAVEGVRVGAALAIAGFAANNEDCQAEIGESGCIPQLVDMLEDGAPSTKQTAADALASLACSAVNQTRILDAKGLPSFTYLMTHQQLSVRTAAARALRNLTAYASKQNKSLVAHNGGAKSCIAALKEAASPKLVELALAILRNLAFRCEENCSLLGQLGVVEALVPTLADQSPECRQSAARLLASVVYKHADAHSQAVSLGTIPPLVGMLQGDDEDKAAAAHALSILATDPAAQAAMAEARTLPALLTALRQTSHPGTLDALVCALGNRVCSDGNYKGVDIVYACQQAAPKLLAMLDGPMASSRQAAAVTVCNLACHGPETQNVLAKIGLIPALVNLLGAAYSMSERLEAAHALCSLVSGDNATAAAKVVKKGAIPALAALLDSSELAARHAAALCLAELVDHAQLQAAVAEGGVLPGLVRLLQEGSGEGQEAAVKVLSALAPAPQLKAEMTKSGSFDALMSLMESGNAQSHMLALGLLQSLDDEVLEEHFDPQELENMVTDLPSSNSVHRGVESLPPSSRRRSVDDSIMRRSIDRAQAS